MLQFPVALTWDELAALPKAADSFSWDPSMIEEGEDDTQLPGYIASYSMAYASSDRLYAYLKRAGYEVTDTGVNIREENSLHLAHALFMAVTVEYDSEDPDPRTTPTWELFGLGGDDDVDYCGTQPSCLTDLLITILRDPSYED